ncbi:MAG: hypothetical protein KAT61_03350 [Gammaproteobacteria bacterium]|nr:hypothetical protein [Gammaproteobacteria bacterium]
MSKKCTVIIAFLLIVIVGGVYKFIFQGSVSESTDGRMAIHLDAGETDLVLMEMRMFLEAVQQIVKGVNENDMKLVAEAARRVGKAAQEAVPGTLMGKLPIDFKKLGFDTHTKFDQLAMDADDLEDSSHALEQLSTLMQNCVACHAGYRLDISTK